MRCAEKKRYKNPEGAIRGALRHSRKYGGLPRFYRCRICKGWHLTTQPQLVVRRSP